jgi:predicted RNA-binding protein with PIN domain
MPVPFHVIDGYNLLHAAGLARRTYGPGDLERSRNRLLALLRTHLRPAERARTTVVFDAADAPFDLPRRLTLEGMTILFAARGGDADTEIERLIAAHSAPRQVRVISSDHRLQKAARRRRSVAIDCEVFLARLDRRGPAAEEPHARRPESPKYGGAMAALETEHWMNVFAEALTSVEIPEDETPGQGAKTHRLATEPSAAAPEPTDPETGSAEPPITPREVAFWQARVDELRRELVDRPGPSAENHD